MDTPILYKKWKNKTTGKEFKVLPWWHCDGSLIDKPKECLIDDKDEWQDRQYALGVLVQIGWLIENDNGVWFGVGPKAKEGFEVSDYTE